MRGVFFPAIAILLSCLVPGGAVATAPRGPVLKEQLSAFLESGKRLEDIKPTQSLYPMSKYPLLATTAYLMFEDDPELLKSYYPALSGMVLDRFKGERLTASGLLRDGVGGRGRAENLSPALNALADLELYSLHLIAWRIGDYEDALDLRGWSNRLSETVTTTFFDPAAEGFYPIDAAGRFVPMLSPGELLPLVLNRSLGDNAVPRVLEAFTARSRELSKPRGFTGELWDDPALRPLVLDLVSRTVEQGSDLLRIVGSDSASQGSGGSTTASAWTGYWKENPSAVSRLFPDWQVVSTLVNLTLLLERESLINAGDMNRLKAGVDSLASALSAKETSLDFYGETIATANGLLGQISRLSELIASNRDRWRMIDATKWLTLSPRTKRLIQEACPVAIDDIMRAKAELSRRLAAGTGITLDVELPRSPVSVGRPIEFHASLASSRDAIDVSQLILQIGENRWKPVEGDVMVSLGPGLAPFTYSESFALPPATEPGVVTLPLFADFLYKGRRIEIHRIESVAIATAYDVAFELPEGRRIGKSPLPVQIAIKLTPDHDLQGTLEGTFLRELTSSPVLPAKFLVKGGSERTNLAVSFSAAANLAPGRYPFTLTLSLDGRALATFTDDLVKPFRWLYLAPATTSEGVLTKGPRYQTDLLKTYKMTDGRTARWRETPPEATDPDGALRPEHIPGTAPNECMLLYTVVDAPTRMRLLWKLSTKNTTAVWFNSEPLVPGVGPHQDETSGAIELRKGPNSFLLAVCMKRSADRIVFELSDENGLPATALGNDLQLIVDGFERLSEPEEPKHEAAPAADRVREITITYESAEATEVSLIGSFNNWDPGGTPMKRVGMKRWTTNLFLAPGRYPYKFLVNHKQKIVDPNSKITEPDGFGGSNSVLEVR